MKASDILRATMLLAGTYYDVGNNQLRSVEEITGYTPPQRGMKSDELVEKTPPFKGKKTSKTRKQRKQLKKKNQ